MPSTVEVSQLSGSRSFASTKAGNLSHRIRWGTRPDRPRNETFNRVYKQNGSNAESPTKPIAEFEQVRLAARIRRAEHVIAPGAIGTVVYIHRGGEAFEVEFSGLQSDVITLKASDIIRVDG